MSRAPTAPAPERPRGGYNEGPCQQCTTMQSIPESAAARVARNMRAIQRLAGSKHDARAQWAHSLFPTRTHPGHYWNFATTSCSSHVHTTPKSAKGISCSLNSAGSETCPRRPSPLASICLNTCHFRCFPDASGFSLPPFDVIFVYRPPS